MDRFSEVDLERWNKLSKDLDQLGAVLYAGVEPQRQRYGEELIAALQSVPPATMDLAGWVRLVTLRYSDTPLGAAGSLKSWGGRFNVGTDVDKAMRAPWPALYIASDHATAYREKFGLAKDDRVNGLTAEQLSLRHDGSYSAVRLNGHLSLVFDIDQAGALDPFCKVLRRIKLPAEAVKLRTRLKMPRQQATMIRTADRLLHQIMVVNWRTWPAQFGNPAVSQIFAGLVLDAGYEAISYSSTKGDGKCIAVFPHRLASDTSFVELADAAPASVQHARLDLKTAGALCGWDTLPRRLRPISEP